MQKLSCWCEVQQVRLCPVLRHGDCSNYMSHVRHTDSSYTPDGREITLKDEEIVLGALTCRGLLEHQLCHHRLAGRAGQRSYPDHHRPHAALPRLQPPDRHPDHQPGVDPRLPGLPAGQSHHQPHLHKVSGDLRQEVDIPQPRHADDWPRHARLAFHEQHATSLTRKIFSSENTSTRKFSINIFSVPELRSVLDSRQHSPSVHSGPREKPTLHQCPSLLHQLWLPTGHLPRPAFPALHA